MIKAVFFDLYHTLVRYDPPREELQAKVLKDFGIEVKPEIFRRPLVIADEFIYQEIAHSPLSQMSEKDKMALYARYQGVLLKEAGIEASEQLILGLLGKMRQFDMKLVQAGVQAPESIYVGDQYRIDVVGANKAGMKGVLLDRGDYFEETADCLRIQSLAQVMDYLSQ